MVLQKEWSWLGGFTAGPAGGPFGKFDIIMNDHTVVTDGHPGIFCFLAISPELGSSKVDVVGLPGERRETHIHCRSSRSVDSSAFIIQPFETE